MSHTRTPASKRTGFTVTRSSANPGRQPWPVMVPVGLSRRGAATTKTRPREQPIQERIHIPPMDEVPNRYWSYWSSIMSRTNHSDFSLCRSDFAETKTQQFDTSRPAGPCQFGYQSNPHEQPSLKDPTGTRFRTRFDVPTDRTRNANLFRRLISAGYTGLAAARQLARSGVGRRSSETRRHKCQLTQWQAN